MTFSNLFLQFAVDREGVDGPGGSLSITLRATADASSVSASIGTSKRKFGKVLLFLVFLLSVRDTSVLSDLLIGFLSPWIPECRWNSPNQKFVLKDRLKDVALIILAQDLPTIASITTLFDWDNTGTI